MAGIHPLGDRAKAVAQARGIVVEIDEGAARPLFDPHRHEIDFGALENAFIEQLAGENKGVLALAVVAPAMERADEAFLAAVARAMRQPHAAVTAGILERFHPVLGVDHDHRVLEDIIQRIVAHLGDFFQAAGHLPDMRPELLLLQFEECGIVIADRWDQLGIGDPVGDCARAWLRCLGS